MTLRFFVFVVMTGLQPQHIRHAVATGFFAVEPLGSFERTMDKHVTTECLVGQFEFFTEVGMGSIGKKGIFSACSVADLS